MSWRPLFLGIAVLLLLLAAALVGPVAAKTTIIASENYTLSETLPAIQQDLVVHSTFTYPGLPSSIISTQIESLRHLQVIVLDGVFATIYEPLPTSLPESSYWTDISYVLNGQTIGTGELGLFKTNSDPERWRLTCTVDDDVGLAVPDGLTGSATVSLVGVPSDFPQLGIVTPRGTTDGDTYPNMGRTTIRGTGYYTNYEIASSYGREHVFYSPDSWSHAISATQYLIVEDIDHAEVSISRQGCVSDVVLQSTNSSLSSLGSSLDFSATLVNAPYRVSILDPYGNWHNRTLFQTSPGSEPTPGEGGTFSLTLSSQTAPIGEPVQATLTAAADAPAYDYLNWQFFPDPAGGERTYRKIDGTWKLYNPGTDAYDLPGTDALNPQFTPTEAGIQNIAVQVYDLAGKKKLADLVKQFEVSESAGTMFPVDVSVFDADTGGGLLNVNLHVTNLQTGATTPITIQTQSVGYRLLLDVGSTYTVAVSKSGYESRTFRVDSTTRTLTARLPKSTSPSNPDQVWLYFYALDGSQTPISGAAVQLSGLSTTLTNSQGLAKIEVSTNTTYQYTVSKTDYTGVSDEIIIESTSQWKYVTLTPTGAAVTSPVPTGPGTVTTPDYRSIDEKATSALSILFDHVELFAALAGLVLLCNMLFWIVPGGKR